MKFNMNNEKLNQVIAKYNGTELTTQILIHSTPRIGRQIVNAQIESQIIGIVISNPLLFIAAAIGVFNTGKKVCLLNSYDNDEYNEFKIKENNIELIITDNKEGVRFFSKNNESKLIVLDEKSLVISNETSCTMNNEIGEFVCGRTLFEADSFVYNENMIENWVNFNINILKMDFTNLTLIWDKTEGFNPYFFFAPLFCDTTLNIIETSEKTLDEIVEIIREIDIKTCFMSLEMLKEFEYEIIMNDENERLFTNVLTFGNGLYDLCSLKEYCNNIGIKWYNYYGNEFVQYITALKKNATGEIYHTGREISGIKAYIMNNALVDMPIGVPGRLFVSSAYSGKSSTEENALIRTEFIAKRTNDDKLIFMGYENNSFYYNGRLCSMEYIKQKLITELQIYDIKQSLCDQSLLIFYSAKNEHRYEEILEFAKNIIPQFYPQIYWILKSEADIHENSFEQLIKNNKTPNSSQLCELKQKLNVIIEKDFAIHITIENNKPVLELFYCLNNEDALSSVQMEEIECIVYETLTEYCCTIEYLKYYAVPETNYKNNSNTFDFNAIRAISHKEIKDLKTRAVLTKEQNDIYEIWKNVLNKDEIGLDDNFFNIGGSSVLFVKLVHELSNYLNKNVPVVDLMGNATIRTSFKFLNMTEDTKEEGFEEILQIDTNVDQYIKNIEEINKAQPYCYKNIFLTGASGFIGVFLLKELLERTDAKIYCLVRSEDINHAYKKLFDTMSYYKLSKYFNKERIIVIVGDLGKDLFGMSKEQYDDFTESIDVVFHNGAAANFVYSYEMLKNENVIGTGRIIEFACTKKIKPINYISSLAIFGVGNKNGVITEQTEPNNPSVPRTGYTKTKWVADNMMLNARKKNIPCNIFRVSNVCGDSVNGICQTKDFIWMLLKLGIDINTIPNYYNVPFCFVTVDSIAKSIVGLALAMEGGNGDNYHIVDDNKVLYTSILDWMQSYGYNLKIVQFNDWVEMIKEYTGNLEASTFQSVPSVIGIKEDVEDDFEFISYENSYTQKQLQSIGDKITPLDEEIFHRHLKHFIDTKFIKDIENQV